jgi:Ni,Fe-hydrogenase III component G
VELAAIKSELEKRFSGSILQVRYFGRSKEPVVWVSPGSLFEVSQYIKTNSLHVLDWLESVTASNIGGTVLVTYFLRSTQKPASQLVLRVSYPTHKSSMKLVSLKAVWNAAARFESDIEKKYEMISFGLGSDS